VTGTNAGIASFPVLDQQLGLVAAEDFCVPPLALNSSASIANWPAGAASFFADLRQY